MSANNSLIADDSISTEGAKRLEWVRERMPIMRRLKKRLGRDRPFDGLKIGICLHVEAKTAVWLEALIAGGADIAITGSPGTTQDDIAAFLVKELGVRVFSNRSETFVEHLQFARMVLDTKPDLIADNGADLHAILASDSKYAELRSAIVGATEETTTGGFRLREEIGKQGFPTIVINDSRAKRIIENRYGVGQSVVDGIMRCTNILLGGLKVAVIGYGYCGRGTAICLRNFGAHVSVVELDPLTQLDAHLEGFNLSNLSDAIDANDMIITVTGRAGVLGTEHFEQMKDGAILVNAGHFETEIDVPALGDIAVNHTASRENLETFTMADGKKLFLLSKGNPVNLAGGEGNPIEVMDLGLALQSLSLAYISENADSMKNEPQNIPARVERAVSEMALDAWT